MALKSSGEQLWLKVSGSVFYAFQNDKCRPTDSKVEEKIIYSLSQNTD